MARHQRGIWTVEVGEQDEFIQDPFDVVFRGATRQNRSCELFSLMPKGVDSLLLQLQLFDDGYVHVETYAPTAIQINPTLRYVFVGVIRNPSIGRERPWYHKYIERLYSDVNSMRSGGPG